jgi:CHAT domain-containing protein/Tfp pilus assembly protein PilF
MSMNPRYPIRTIVLLTAFALSFRYMPGPVAAQTDELAAVHAKVIELEKSGRNSEAIGFAERELAIKEKMFGPDHREVGVSLHDLAVLYGTQGRYAEAAPLHKRSLAIWEKALGPNGLNVGVTLHNLADVYRTLGRNAEAEPLFKRSLSIQEKALGRDHPYVAATLGALAVLYTSQGRYLEAEPLRRRALAIEEKAFGPDHINVAWALTNLGNLYLKQGRYAEAEPAYQRALAIREKALGPDSPDVAISLNNLAFLDDILGRFAEAEPLYKRSLAIREKVFGREHREVAESLENLAHLYRSQGHHADAEPLFKRSLAMWEKTLGSDHPNVANALDELALLYTMQGRYTDAEPLYRRSLAILEKAVGPNHPDVMVPIDGLASLYIEEGRYADEIEPLYKRSLSIAEKGLGPDHPNVAAGLNNLALFYVNHGRYVDAEPLYKRALAIEEKVLGHDHPTLAATLNNLALLDVDQGHFADAEPLYMRSLAIREKVLGDNNPNVATSLNNLAGLYTRQSRYADAKPLYKRALAIRETTLGPDHPRVADSLNDMVHFYGIQGQYADAIPMAQHAVDIGRASPSLVLPVLAGAGREGLMTEEAAIDDALTVVQRATQTSAATAVAKLALRLAAGNDRLAELVRSDQDLAKEAEALDAAIVTAASMEPSRRDSLAEQRMRDRLAAVTVERAALQKTFATEFPDYAALTKPSPMSAKAIQSLLGPNEALVAFATAGKERSYVFALTQARFEWREISLGADDLSNKVATFRRGLDVNQIVDTSGKTQLFDLNRANELYVALFGPIEDLIKDKAQLLIVPTGALTALPFHLLVTEKPPTAVPAKLDGYRDAAWLIKRQAVAVLPSIASLDALRSLGRSNRAGKPLIGFGDPIFNPGAAPLEGSPPTARTAARSLNTRSYTDFWQGAAIDRSKLAQNLPPLSDTAIELRSIAQSVGAPAADIHLGRDASETTLKRAPLSDYRIVYFATHALVAGDVKGLAEPSLVLSAPPQPSEADDGLLTASEVAQLKLNADWVVLSACNTIAGDKPGAEALSGLARSFFYAGARALLVSHWAVESDAATRLMSSTFEKLKSDPKLGRAEALRQAMLGYLNDRTSPQNAYPAFWGPFALIGEGASQ